MNRLFRGCLLVCNHVSMASSILPKEGATKVNSVVGLCCQGLQRNALIGNADFALHVQQHIRRQSANGCSPAIDCSVYIKALPLPADELSNSERFKLDRAGVTLWNTCTRLRRTSDEKAAITRGRVPGRSRRHNIC